jgi:hypothetical protein
MAPLSKGTTLVRKKDGVRFTVEAYKNKNGDKPRRAVLRNTSNNRAIERPTAKLKAEFETA